MDWRQLQREILDDPPDDGELLYIARSGETYTWCVVGDASQPPHATPGITPPEAWLYYSWLSSRVTPDVPPPPSSADAFFADLHAELESMAGGEDRCRWPLDEPWPHGH